MYDVVDYSFERILSYYTDEVYGNIIERELYYTYDDAITIPHSYGMRIKYDGVDDTIEWYIVRVLSSIIDEYYSTPYRQGLPYDSYFIFEPALMYHVKYSGTDIYFIAPDVYKYAIDNIIQEVNVIHKFVELNIIDCNLKVALNYEDAITHADYQEHIEVYQSDIIIDDGVYCIRKPSIIYSDGADITLYQISRRVYCPTSYDIIILLKMPFIAELILFDGKEPVIHEIDVLKYLKASISGILNAHLTQYVKYPDTFVIKSCVSRINALVGRRIITENDILNAIRETHKPILYPITDKYYTSGIPKTHVLILRDKLVVDIKKIIPKVLKIIEERYYRL